MSIEVGCSCGRMFKAKDEHAGRRAKCPACGTILVVPRPSSELFSGIGAVNLDYLHEGLAEDLVGVTREASLTDVWKVLNAILTRMNAEPSEGPVSNGHRREYKVVTQKDKWFSGKFDPEKVEGALNSYASQGWSLKGVATASVHGLGGQRDEIVIIMER